MNTILLTGGTGLIGSAVLHASLSDPSSDERWLCLVRADTADLARARLVAQLQRFCPVADAVRLLKHVEVIAGDFTSDRWIDDPCLVDVTHVLHLAADTSWWGEEKVHRTNHHGTLAFARRMMRLPRLVRFLHVSTAMICGGEAGPLVKEDSFPHADAVHLVSYSGSKAAAEVALTRELPDLPLVIARPSIVVGHTQLGAQPSASILWMFRAADRLRLVGCRLDGSVDVVPSDWTAEMLLGLLRKESLAHRVYHLSAGEAGRASWDSLARAFETADTAGGPRVYERLHPNERSRLCARFEAEFGLDSIQKVTMLRAMQAYYRFCELDVTFCNKRLLDEGFRPSPSFATYLPQCLNPRSDIVAQFADDLNMFTGDSRRVRQRPQTAAPAWLQGAAAAIA